MVTYDGAVEAIKLGAYDYVTKPIDDIRLKLTIKRALEQKQLLASYQSLKKKIRPWEMDDRIIVKDRKMIELLDIVHMVSETMATILITGESGPANLCWPSIFTAIPPAMKVPL